jgi:heme A synthase
LNWNRWIRQIHRWLSVALTAAIIINGVAIVKAKYNAKLGLMAVGLLALLWLSGAYLWVLPYAARWRSSRRAG